MGTTRRTNVLRKSSHACLKWIRILDINKGTDRKCGGTNIVISQNGLRMENKGP
jgi:hypothetical protein